MHSPWVIIWSSLSVGDPPMSYVENVLPRTDEINSLLAEVLAGTDIDLSSIITTHQCLVAIDQARRPFPVDPSQVDTERSRINAAIRLVCLVALTNASALPGLVNKEAARLFRDFADGVPVTTDRLKRHQVLGRLSVVPT